MSRQVVQKGDTLKQWVDRMHSLFYEEHLAKGVLKDSRNWGNPNHYTTALSPNSVFYLFYVLEDSRIVHIIQFKFISDSKLITKTKDPLFSKKSEFESEQALHAYLTANHFTFIDCKFPKKQELKECKRELSIETILNSELNSEPKTEAIVVPLTTVAKTAEIITLPGSVENKTPPQRKKSVSVFRPMPAPQSMDAPNPIINVVKKKRGFCPNLCGA